MNIGIIIAISDYIDKELSNLPACKNDASVMAELLRSDSKFDDILIIDESTNSTAVKSKVTEFVSKHKANDIKEIVFYYTGHGELVDNEFYYLLSDFDSSRRKQTSLENSEVDNLLRSLSPNLTVKIVDACQSGTRYLKDRSALSKHVEEIRHEFKNFYFLFSSNSDQSSYQDRSLSFFTKAIIESVIEHSENTIRYKDVMDFVSDWFESSKKQTPFFVSQADYTETFCSISDSLRKSLKDLMTETSSNASPSKDTISKTLVELISEDAERYGTQDDANESFQKIEEYLDSAQHPEVVNKIFKLEVSRESNYSESLDMRIIGKWLDDHSHNYFAKPYWEVVKVKKRIPKKINPLLSAFDFLYEEEYEICEVEEEQIVDYELTVKMPYLYLVLKVEPRFPNLSYHELYIAPIVSKTSLQLFINFCRYQDTGWSSRHLATNKHWNIQSCELKNHQKIKQIVTETTEQFWEFVLEPIKKQYNQ